MKSQQQEKIKTNCKECIFAVYDGKTQVSCSNNRITLFGNDVIEAYDNEKEFYVINRFCNYYRQIGWNNGKIDLKKLKKETDIPFDLFISAKDVSSNELINLLSNIKYDKNKIKSNIFYQMLDNISMMEIKNFIMQKTFIVTACEDINKYLHNSIILSKNNYHAVLINDNKHKISNIDKINHIINNDLKQAIIFNLNGVEFISNIAYKLESLINNSISYIENLTSLKQKAQQENMYIEIGND